MAERRLLARFWSKVEVGDGRKCWPWLACTDGGGYGRFQLWTDGRSQTVAAHRFSYQEARGPVPEGLVLDHLCRNRSCCNPNHLEVVTRGENVMRGVGISVFYAARDCCKNGHPYTEDNTIRYGERSGRICRTCKKLAGKRYYQRKRIRA